MQANDFLRPRMRPHVFCQIRKECIYLFILSDPKDLWLLNPNKAFFIYIYKGGKRWHLVRGPGEEVEDGIGFCSPIILATGIRQTGGGGQLTLGKRGYAVIYVEEIVFVYVVSNLE